MRLETGSLAHRTGYRLERSWDRLWSRVKRRMGWLDPVTIQPFRGYGDGIRVRARARVLEENGVSEDHRDRGTLGNLAEMFRRFESDEITGAKVRVSFDYQTLDLVSDEEGYLEVAIDDFNGQRRDELSWQELSFELIEPYQDGQPRPLRVAGSVLLPPANADFAVISDIDDTILKTGATSLLRNLRTTLLSSLEDRLPFLGVAAFYKALQTGRESSPRNPLFYVSSSPWNLYDFLEAFMDRHGIPAGPMFLRDLGLDETKVIKSGHGGHKLAAITTLMDFYPNLDFILIGDSGQHDAGIYRDAVKRYPGRVRSVYIRALNEAPDRDERALKLLDEIEKEGVQTALCRDLVLAAEGAAESGWISPEAIDDIKAEVSAHQEQERRK